MLCVEFDWREFVRTYVRYTRSMTILFCILNCCFVQFFSTSLSSSISWMPKSKTCTRANNTHFFFHSSAPCRFFYIFFWFHFIFCCVRIWCVQFHGSINSNTRSRNGVPFSVENLRSFAHSPDAHTHHTIKQFKYIWLWHSFGREWLQMCDLMNHSLNIK